MCEQKSVLVSPCHNSYITRKPPLSSRSPIQVRLKYQGYLPAFPTKRSTAIFLTPIPIYQVKPNQSPNQYEKEKKERERLVSSSRNSAVLRLDQLPKLEPRDEVALLDEPCVANLPLPIRVIELDL